MTGHSTLGHCEGREAIHGSSGMRVSCDPSIESARRLGNDEPRRGGLKPALSVLCIIMVGGASPSVTTFDEQSRLNAAAALYDAADYETNVQIYIRQVISAYAETLSRLASSRQPDQQAKIEAIIAPDFQPVGVALRRTSLFVMSKDFTTREMTQLTTLLSDPLMVRLKQGHSQRLTEMYDLVRPALRDVPTNIWDHHHAELSALGIARNGVVR